MIRLFKNISVMVTVLGALVLFNMAPGAVRAEEIRYDGTFTLAANGDLTVVIKLTPTMAIYQKLRESISNLHLLMRDFASSRADTEVVDKKPEWDDANRTITLSMKMLGAARNMANRWEAEIPKGADFINLDEGKRTFYFNEMVVTAGGATIRGTSKLILPPSAQKFKWEESRRMVSYVMPVPPPASSDTTVILWLGAALAVGGVGLAGASLVIKPTSLLARPS
jgi:hypothetical protein